MLATLVAGCSSDDWETSSKARAPDYAVAHALDDIATGSADISAASVPVIAPPAALRPCCALGVDLKVAVGRVPVPGVELANVTGRESLGPHRFNNGFLSLDVEDTRGWIDNEGNGIVYTCRGGFLDTAHVRDNADITMACASAIARMMDAGGTLDLPPQGAAMRVRIRPVDPALLARLGRRDLTIPMAQWIAWQISIWHEIATWYGYTSTAGWPEKISAFSPEDLYSNMVGIRIAGGILAERGASSDDEYNRSVDAWIRQVGRRLQAVSGDDSREALTAVDGIWWDSSRRIPDWQLVRRRNFETGPVLRPWVVSRATPAPQKPFTGCDPAATPLDLRAHDGFEGILFRDLLTLEIEIDDMLANNGFPLPRAGTRTITQEDFPAVIDAVRRDNAAAFGVPADAP